MKKLFLTVIAILLTTSIAYAGCRVGANWVPDPSGAAIDQELWYNPDGVVDNGDEVLGQSYVGGATNTGNFLSATDCTAMPSVTVFVKSHYTGGIELVSNEIAPSDIVPAVLSLAIKHTE